ncbi:hypothetical protein [Sphingomonas alpina]|uniref:Uncharacterized protein n=1 Tax=Sphingomonas alpina TaxID=653931 RepID=A0A7H0LFR1_9SPHN|nr:hypothetical protein [Sphingomonas alpina]QNQ08514.1 hypothetical protein H3Z74_17425 [Sphingomonas alpina]
MTPGPSLERLMRRLAETPGEFLGEPRIGAVGTVATAALVGDLLRGAGIAIDRQMLARFEGDRPAERNRLMLVAVTVWLLADDWVGTPSRDGLLGLLDDTVGELAATGHAQAFVEDAERREELARTVLAALELLPEGEDARQAADRLSAVSATERQRLIRASREAEERARLVREALIRKAAEESADKYTRE